MPAKFSFYINCVRRIRTRTRIGSMSFLSSCLPSCNRGPPQYFLSLWAHLLLTLNCIVTLSTEFVYSSWVEECIFKHTARNRRRSSRNELLRLDPQSFPRTPVLALEVHNSFRPQTIKERQAHYSHSRTRQRRSKRDSCLWNWEARGRDHDQE